MHFLGSLPNNNLNPPSESKPQVWSAVAAQNDGTEQVIFLDRSTVQVRDGYRAAHADVIDGQKRECVRRNPLLCRQGAADRGRWVAADPLPVPPDR